MIGGFTEIYYKAEGEGLQSTKKDIRRRNKKDRQPPIF